MFISGNCRISAVSLFPKTEQSFRNLNERRGRSMMEKLTMYGGTCPEDGGELTLVLCDGEAVYFQCKACGHKERYVFADQAEASAYQEKEKCRVLEKVREGIRDWQVTQWEALRREIVDFMLKFPMFERDILIGMALIACLTYGYRWLDRKTHRQCKTIFAFNEKNYRERWRTLDKKSRRSELPCDMKEYGELRKQYLALKKCYINDGRSRVAVELRMLRIVLRPFFRF